MKILDLTREWTDLKPHGDISDVVDMEGSKKDVLRRLEALQITTPVYTPHNTEAAQEAAQSPEDAFFECFRPLSDFDEREATWLIPGWVPKGQITLLAADGGTGKTTHYNQWKRQYGGEISIIHGDKPVLDFSEEGISVHPSPWRGKENMGSMRSAPLGGIIMLKQGQENAMRRVEPKEAVAELFMQFLFTRSTPLDVRRVCALEERLLQTVPVWQLVNRGDEASARLCHDTLAKEMYNA